MRSLIRVLLTALVFSSAAFAQIIGSASGQVGAAQVIPGSQISTTNGAQSFRLVYTPNGAPASLSIQIEGSSNGGVTYALCGSAATVTNSTTTINCTGTTFDHVQVNLTVLTGGTNPTVVWQLTTLGGQVVSVNSPLCSFCSTNTVDAFTLVDTTGTKITTSDQISGVSLFYIDPSAANPGRRVFLRQSAGNLATSDSAITEQWNMAAPGGASSTFSYNSNSHVQNNTGNQDCTPNCKTYSPGEVHLMGTISKSQETNNGGVTLYGTEARVDSLGSNSAAGANHKGQRYIGGVMVATWSAVGTGGSFGAQVHGEESLTQIVTDNTFLTGANSGLRAGFVNRPGLGGDPNARIGFLEQDVGTGGNGGNFSPIHGLSAPGLNTVTRWLPTTTYPNGALVWPTLVPTGLYYKMTTAVNCISNTVEPGTGNQAAIEWPFASGGTITETANGGNACVWQEVRVRSEAFGKGANSGSATGFDTAVGDGSTATGGASNAVGALANCTSAGSQCYGEGATDTAANQVVYGSNGAPALHFFYGRGVTSASAQAVDFNITGGSGTNIAGGARIMRAGAGTGNATPAIQEFDGTVALASGTTAQSQVARFVLNDTKTLTSGVAATLLSIPLAADQTAGGSINFTALATDTVNHLNCSTSGEVTYSAENSAGVFVTSSQILGTNATACTVTLTLTCTTAITGANPSLLQITCTLVNMAAPTSFNVVYTVDHHGGTNPTL